MTDQQYIQNLFERHAALNAAVDDATITLDEMERCGDVADKEYTAAERHFFQLYDLRAELDEAMLESPQALLSYKCATVARLIESQPERAAELLRRLADQASAGQASNKS